MKKTLLLLFSVALALPLGAQTAREEIEADRAKAAGLHYAYPGPQSVQTPAPKGYKPFYISHFGRHGSRWHVSKEDYTAPLGLLDSAHKAGALTPVGEEVLVKARALWEDAERRTGELTPLGKKQHEGVASRMFASFPEAFKGNARVTANSTTSGRVMMSMFYFCNTLKKLNPALQIDINSSRRDSRFVSNRVKRSDSARSDRLKAQEALGRKILKPERLMGVLFSDPSFIKGLDGPQVMWNLYYLAEMAQNVELDSESFLDIFTADELYDCWRLDNYEMYLYAADPREQDVIAPSCKPMIEHIIEKADETIESGGRGATLRFSHDSYLVPMAVCLRLEGCTGQSEDPEQCDQVFIDYKISPMCGNIQLVFFKNKKGEVLVKFLLNENEVRIPVESELAPYYHWEDVKAYYKQLYQI